MISPVEIFMHLLIGISDRDVVPHVIVGPASHDEQQEGVASIMDASNEGIELYAPLVKPRFQVRCIGPTLSQSEEIGNHVAFRVNAAEGRHLIQQANGETYVVHSVYLSGGPSAHRDTDGTWEYLVFVGAIMGTSHVPLLP